MSGLRRMTRILPALLVALMIGCQTGGAKRPSTVITPAPAVSDAGDASTVGGERTSSAAPVQTVTFADRHPLFRRPREYYDSGGDNKLAKVARATFIGVPSGFVGEVKQVFTGVPPQ